LDIEKVALEAIKQKIEEIFKKVQIKSAIEGRDIVFRISIPNEIMQIQENPLRQNFTNINTNTASIASSNLDAEAEAAARELLGT